LQSAQVPQERRSLSHIALSLTVALVVWPMFWPSAFGGGVYLMMTPPFSPVIYFVFKGLAWLFVDD
jgi:hypothetical protein